MTTLQDNFTELIATLRDESQELSFGTLTKFAETLSDIAPVQLKPLLEVWDDVSLSRRHALLAHLKRELDDNLLYNFNALARPLLHDEDGITRTYAIRLLADYEREDLIPTFIDIALNDSEVETRTDTISLLGFYVHYGELDEVSDEGLKKIEEALLQIAQNAKRAKFKQYAVEALGFSSREEVPALIEKAWQEETAMWKASALFAMGRSYDSDRWQEQVLEGLVHENEIVRLAATKSAGNLSLDLARPILLNSLREEDDEVVLRASIWSLSEIGGEDVREHLLSLLDQLEGEDEQEAFLEDALANLDFTEGVQNLEYFDFDTP